MSTGFSPRGVLFVPAHSTDKFGKVGRSGPDALQRIQLCCANNQPNVISGVPGLS
jgi:hypothetical protein